MKNSRYIARFLFISLLAAQTCCSTECEEELKSLNIEIIAPSSGEPNEIWEKVFEKTGTRAEKNTKTSDQQIFADPNKKFEILDKSLRTRKKILWTFRGGYGLDKIMKMVADTDYSMIPKKTILGYSDTTSLHLHFSQEYGWKTISCCVLREAVMNQKNRENYKKLIRYLIGTDKRLKIQDMEPLNKEAKDSKLLKGKTTGGNLTIIETSIGTPWQIVSAGKILFLEDVGVSGYCLDRILVHLDNAGIFDDVVAIIFGDFCADVTAILDNFAKNTMIPVFRSFSFGHGKNNYPIGYNFKGEINVSSNKKYSLVMESFASFSTSDHLLFFRDCPDNYIPTFS